MHDLPPIDRRVHFGLMENLRSLMKRTNIYLQETGCTTEHVVTCIMDVRHIKCTLNGSQLKDVVSATSINDAFSGLTTRNVLPFEHYSTIKRIIITLCSKNEALEKELRLYEDALRGFTMSKAMGSAKFYDENPCSNEAQDMVELIITTNSSWNECPVLLNVLDLEDTIAKIFQCEIFALHLRSIDNEPQSVTLCFALSYNILKSVFPLTTEEWISVTNHGVVELKCLEFDYNIIMQEKGISTFK